MEEISRSVGRPPKWNTPEELQKEIDAYFKKCEEEEEPLTITGLALALDTYRDVLMDYQNKDEFSNTVKRAKQRIEHAYEKRLIANGRAGDIFALKKINNRYYGLTNDEIDSVMSILNTESRNK